MGTSICHILLGREPAVVEGMCGVVEDGVVPGLFGFEAGQSAVGDIFAWFVERCVPPEHHEAAARRGLGRHQLHGEALGDEQGAQRFLRRLESAHRFLSQSRGPGRMAPGQGKPQHQSDETEPGHRSTSIADSHWLRRNPASVAGAESSKPR